MESQTGRRRTTATLSQGSFFSSIFAVWNTTRSVWIISHSPGHIAENSAPQPDLQDSQERTAERLDCLEHCLQRLEPENRELILHYYHGEQRAKIENRRALATRLGLTANVLSLRACRIRVRLEGCVSQCFERKK